MTNKIIINDFPVFPTCFNKSDALIKLFYPNADSYFLKNGRTALFQGLTCIFEPNRTDILVPAYNCGIELETIIRCGYRPVFYRINKNCNIDLNHLSGLINHRTLGVLVTYFNGFPQEIEKIKEICDRYDNLLIIEDCAHVLKTSIKGEKLGTFGDIAVFSPRKYLPMPNGGLLILNNEKIDKKPNIVNISMNEIIKEVLYLLKSFIKIKLLRYSMHYYVDQKRENVIGDGYVVHDFYEANYQTSMSPISDFVMRRCDIDRVVDIRKKNYRRLHESIQEIQGINSLQGPLPDSVCPWHYLAELLDPYALYRYLMEKGIKTILFWSYFHAKYPFGMFPESEYLKKHVIALPIHQDLSDVHMNIIIKNIKEFFKRND